MATQPTPHIPIQEEYDDPTIVYPCEDDEPLAETEFQYEPLTYAVAALKAYFSDREDVYAQGDMFVYYRRNDPGSVVVPDVFVVFGANGNHKRNSWLIWREGGRPPNFVLEVASESTWQWDATGKRDIYAQIGVDEYWRFDPTGNCFDPPLVGERLVDGEYQPIDVAEDADGILRGRSEVLGLDICVLAELELRIYDPADSEWLLSYDEQAAALEETHAVLEATQVAFESEQAAREAAERRVRELEELLRRRNGDSTESG